MNQITNYGELKEAVLKWANRKDKHTVDNIGIFINHAEKQIYRNLRIPAFEGEVQVTVTDDNTIAIPYDVIELKHIYSAQGEVYSRVALPALMTQTNSFARTTSNIRFSKDVKPGTKIFITYYRDQQELGPADDDTNVLLTIAPDVILYCALRALARFTNDVEEIGKWDSLFKNAYITLDAQAKSLEFSGGANTTATAFPGFGGFNGQ